MLIRLLAGWLAIDALLFAMLLNRRPYPRVRHRLFRWAMGAPKQGRNRRFAHDLVVATHHRH
jgi:hypothetical protein